MSTEKLIPSFSFNAERLRDLESVVPEAFTDGKIDWETLRETLGDYLEDESAGAEHFGLNWPGKREARRLAAKPSHGTLTPAVGEGVNEDATSNLFIEGDNLEVLKLLQKSYSGRVKMIYIDPPYNTGNDFIYKDDFSEPLESYLARSGQLNEKGELLTTNPKVGGRFHSNWLNMIYPRLRLARTLLRDDGVIFVSIDDNEVHNLRAMMNEIFGEENFVASVLWQKRTSPDGRLMLGAAHDYVICFLKGSTAREVIQLVPLGADRIADYKNPDNDPRGLWASVDLTGQTGHATPSQFYEVITPSGIKYRPPEGRCWALAEATFISLDKDKRIWYGKNGDARPRLKRFLEEAEGTTSWTWWTNQEVGHNQKATKEVADLVGEAGLFDNPKPIRLLKKILQLGTMKNEQAIVLDFFAGSGTTAHAVALLNRDDGGDRQFICVQVPEPTPKNSNARRAGYETISDLSKERIRLALAKISTQPTLPTREISEDLGFKVFKLAPSNLKQWRESDGKDLAAVGSLFDQFETPLCNDWTPESLLSEVLLIEGFPLDSKVISISGLPNAVSRVSSSACGHKLIVCFDEKLNAGLLDSLEVEETDVFVCLDSALTDDFKLRLGQLCTLKTI